jgi:hypothetical protein
MAAIIAAMTASAMNFVRLLIYSASDLSLSNRLCGLEFAPLPGTNVKQHYTNDASQSSSKRRDAGHIASIDIKDCLRVETCTENAPAKVEIEAAQSCERSQLMDAVSQKPAK